MQGQGHDFPEFFNGADFTNAWSTPRPDGKKIFLIWDECDTYASSQQYPDVWKEILTFVRGIRDSIELLPLLKVTSTLSNLIPILFF